MKKIILIAFFAMPILASAAKFSFPNLDYSYARLYLFNTVPPTKESFYDFDIYRDGRYANSKIGNGWEVKPQMIADMNAVFSKGVDAMVGGLSGCYIPRHGIIFFDAGNQPVASFSACFECSRIGFWSLEPLPEFSEPSSGSYKKAEKQFGALVAILDRYEIPNFESQDHYTEFVNNEELYGNSGEMVFEFPDDNTFSESKFTLNDVKSWIISNYHFTPKETVETEPSPKRDMADRRYTVLSDHGGTTFEFSTDKPDAYLVEATITNSAVILPNGISVGMSLEQVQASFSVWDGISNPESIVSVYPYLTIRYIIEKHTLKKIVLIFAR